MNRVKHGHDIAIHIRQSYSIYSFLSKWNNGGRFKLTVCASQSIFLNVLVSTEHAYPSEV